MATTSGISECREHLRIQMTTQVAKAMPGCHFDGCFLLPIFSPRPRLNDVFKGCLQKQVVFFLGPRPQRENEMNSGQYDMLTLEIDWGVKNPYRSLGFVILAKQGCWVFSEKKKGKWPYNCIGYGYIQSLFFFDYHKAVAFLLTLRLKLHLYLPLGLQRETLKVNFATVIWIEKNNKMVGDHQKQMGWHLTIPKKWTVPSLPNTSWEGVLGMFLGSKHVLARCLEA